MKVSVSKLDKPYRDGDFKDPPLKWTVTGPGTERQDFCTKKNAMQYASIRRKCSTQREAGDRYVRA